MGYFSCLFDLCFTVTKHQLARSLYLEVSEERAGQLNSFKMKLSLTRSLAVKAKIGFTELNLGTLEVISERKESFIRILSGL